MSLAGVDKLRVGPCNQAPINPSGEYLLYWMTGARRLSHNPSLDAAVAQCEALGRPLVLFEPIRIDYQHVCPRHHRFVIDGMKDQQERCASLGLRYLPAVERRPGELKALFKELCEKAALVIADQHPGGWLRSVHEHTLDALSLRVQLIDSVGLVPLALAEKNYLRAFDFRRFVARELPSVVQAFPRKLSLDQAVLRNAPLSLSESAQALLDATQALLDRPESLASSLKLEGPPPTSMRGGYHAALERWQGFRKRALGQYADSRHHPDAQVESRQSPYLHYGQIGAHELLEGLLADEGLDLDSWVEQHPRVLENKESRWGLSPGADGFLDQLFVWRELGQHLAHRRPSEFESYDVLPQWARDSLAEHAQDSREAIYSLETLEMSRTADPVWNAAQNQLRHEGHIHNYLRMLWGKRVLAWSSSPEQAFERLVFLNNRYALDGRDPNSYSGIGWTFGLFDRPWGPERPIYGKIRYMTTQSTLRKLKLKQYLQEFGSSEDQASLF